MIGPHGNKRLETAAFGVRVNPLRQRAPSRLAHSPAWMKLAQ
jgi:hypothetical protein